MGWFRDHRADDAISHRLDDAVRNSTEQHREIRDDLRALSARTDTAIKDLSDQTRGEFSAMRKDVQDRHIENRRLLYGAVIVLLGALAANYLAQHGFSAPGVEAGKTDVQKLGDKLDTLILQGRGRNLPGVGQ